jgi:hypothetical protein
LQIITRNFPIGFAHFEMQIPCKVTARSQKKTPLGALTHGVTQATTRKPGFLHPNVTGPDGFTSPICGDFAPSLDESSRILNIFGTSNFVKS